MAAWHVAMHMLHRYSDYDTLSFLRSVTDDDPPAQQWGGARRTNLPISSPHSSSRNTQQVQGTATYPPLGNARGADLLQDVLELVISHFCEELPLWQHHVPAVVLYQVQRLIYCLQNMRNWVSPSPPAQKSIGLGDAVISLLNPVATACGRGAVMVL